MKIITTNQVKKIFHKIYDKEYQKFYDKKYFFIKPYLHIYSCPSNNLGMFCFEGYKYSKDQPCIKINIDTLNKVGKNTYEYDKDKFLRIKETITHELCHAARDMYLGLGLEYDKYRRRERKTIPASHDKRFWSLAKEMGLKKNQYGLGVTKAMIRGYRD